MRARGPGVSGHGRMFGGYASAGPVRQGPRLALRDVPCPDCGAEVGAQCHSTNGKPLPNGHRSRQRMASRAASQRRAEETQPEPTQSAQVVEQVAGGIHSWYAYCPDCGWNCMSGHTPPEPHWREALAAKHAAKHTCREVAP